MVTIRQVEVVSATPASTLSLLRRPSCIPSTQMMPPMAMRTNATIVLSPVSGQSRRRVTATVTATESPDRLQASSVRSRARPGSLPPPSSTLSTLSNVSVESYFEPMRARTTAMTATAPTPIESTSGIGERGRGSPRRIARSLARQCRKLVIATRAPSAIIGKPRIRRPPSTWNSGNSWVAAIPVAIRAKAVRFHARNVRSLA